VVSAGAAIARALSSAGARVGISEEDGLIVALKELAAELSICDKQVLPKFFMPAKWMAVTSRVMKWMPFVKIANHLSVAAPMDVFVSNAGGHHVLRRSMIGGTARGSMMMAAQGSAST
jgi:hypothetical protein